MTNAILFYVDGHLYETQNQLEQSVGSYPVPFNRPFFLLMNFAIGGNYVGNPSTAAINAGTAFSGRDGGGLTCASTTSPILFASP